MESNIDLTICQDCKKNPAIYGDGVTWSRCSACQLKFSQSSGKVEEKSQPPVDTKESFAHEISEGLTSIILPIYMNNYPLFHYTGNCIGSVREHTPKESYELVVVDNGSPLPAPEISSYYADRVIKNESNLGVTKAWNQGIRVSVGEYIVLLNNDVQVFEHWLEDLKDVLDNQGYDLVMAHPMYSLTEPFARAVESAKIRQEFKDGKRSPSLSDFRDFSCVMFHRSLIDEIGLFDERFFNYCSDSDFIRRMEEKGKKWCCVEYVPTSHLSDATGFSIKETPELMNKDKATYEDKYKDWQPPKVEAPKEKEMKPGDQLVRTPDTGDMIFFIRGNKYHHIKDPDALHGLGFDFGDEKTIKIDELTTGRSNGEEITSDNAKSYA